jgi:hypothetical protein
MAKFVLTILPDVHLETVIPGCEQSERTRNPEQRKVLDSGSAPKRAHPGMTMD